MLEDVALVSLCVGKTYRKSNNKETSVRTLSPLQPPAVREGQGLVWAELLQKIHLLEEAVMLFHLRENVHMLRQAQCFLKETAKLETSTDFQSFSLLLPGVKRRDCKRRNKLSTSSPETVFLLSEEVCIQISLSLERIWVCWHAAGMGQKLATTSPSRQVL